MGDIACTKHSDNGINAPKVIYIGGVPFIGKTSAALLLASRLKYATISTDDICAALCAATPPQTHPEFHYMKDYGFPEYYVRCTVDRLISDSNAVHQSVWQPLEVLFQNHMNWGCPVIVEGWALRPEYVARLTGDVAGVFLVTDEALIEERVRRSGFGAGASNKEKMITQYLARSFWYNDTVKKSVVEYGLNAVVVTQTMTPETIADACMKMVSGE